MDAPPRGGAIGAVRRWPVWLRASVAGAVVVLCAAVVTLLLRPDGADPDKIGVGPDSSGSSGPSFPVQQYQAGDLTVNVPAGWKKAPPQSGTYMDFRDPQAPAEAARWVRVDVGAAGDATATSILEGAAARFQRGEGCEGYQPIGDLRDIELAGHPGTEFEYTCAPENGGIKRHGIWRVIVADGKRYGITMSVPDDQFDSSRHIFEEMVRSLALA